MICLTSLYKWKIKRITLTVLVNNWKLGSSSQSMKRYGNLFEKIIDMDNLRLAHKNASKGKSKYKDVKMVNTNIDYRKWRRNKSWSRS